LLFPEYEYVLQCFTNCIIDNQVEHSTEESKIWWLQYYFGTILVVHKNNNTIRNYFGSVKKQETIQNISIFYC